MKTAQTRRRPGTTAMVVGIAAMAVYSFWSKPATATTRSFEADSSGVLREVQRRETDAKPQLRLVKPEPNFILARADSFALSAKQSQSIGQIADEWAGQKASFESNLASAQSQAGVETTSSLGELKAGLADYSELSREFGRAREQFWERAVAVLGRDQQRALAAALDQERKR